MKPVPAAALSFASLASAAPGATNSTAIRARDLVIATSQLGYRPQSPKTVTLLAHRDVTEVERLLPDTIPFWVQGVGDRRARAQAKPAWWKDELFRWPFDPLEGAVTPDGRNYMSFHDRPLFEGLLRRAETRWGTVWQGDFSAYQDEGTWQIETPFLMSTPFMIAKDPYQRLLRGYLVFLFSQRSGFDVPGIRPAENADDAVLDRDRTPIPASGGWNDAGDTRKWLFLTLPNLEALTQVAAFGHPAFRQPAIDEIAWGNRYFHAMINDAGQVYEDVGGGPLRKGQVYERDWWVENHPGVSATGEKNTDNVPGTGDERTVRTDYAPLPQFQFARYQAQAASVLPPAEASRALVLAERAWRYGQEKGHDRRTLFVAEELLAGLESIAARSRTVAPAQIAALTEELLSRQDAGGDGLSHYFLEKDGTDGYRSVAFSAEPPFAILRLAELRPAGLQALADRAAKALADHVDRYLLADAGSNPFGLTPYGVFVDPPHADVQTFGPRAAVAACARSSTRGTRSRCPTEWEEPIFSTRIFSPAPAARSVAPTGRPTRSGFCNGPWDTTPRGSASSPESASVTRCPRRSTTTRSRRRRWSASSVGLTTRRTSRRRTRSSGARRRSGTCRSSIPSAPPRT